MSQKLFEDLGFSPQEAAALKLKADLNTKIVKAAAGYTQQELQSKLGTSQPRVSDLLRGKMAKFSLDPATLPVCGRHLASGRGFRGKVA